jgi:uncharacterized protein YaiL (DUF2058 family)
MGNLRDELLKKGLTSDKRARAVLHEEKARQKQLGPEAAAAERAEREAKARQEAEEQRAADRRREEERRQSDAEERGAHRIQGLILAGLVREGAAGNRRFYFVTREHTISFLELSDTAARSLGDGRVAVVESGGIGRADFCLVAAEQAAEIARLDPERVRFWNSGGASRPGSG